MSSKSSLQWTSDKKRVAIILANGAKTPYAISKTLFLQNLRKLLEIGHVSEEEGISLIQEAFVSAELPTSMEGDFKSDLLRLYAVEAQRLQKLFSITKTSVVETSAAESNLPVGKQAFS